MRQANENDIRCLQDLLTDLAEHPLTTDDVADRLNMISQNNGQWLFVCEDMDRVVGVLGFRIRENVEEATRYGEISAIIVDSKDRKRGIGRFMMDYAEDLAKQLGCKGTWLVSGFGREQEAHVFYRDLGYQITGYRFVKLFQQEQDKT